MSDPFFSLARTPRIPSGSPSGNLTSKTGHSDRAHSKFSASGAERWLACPGSVELSEGMPDKSSSWALEGTEAHEVLEQVMLNRLGLPNTFFNCAHKHEMLVHAQNAADFILGLYKRTENSEALVETRIKLDFIHPEMFGTFDGAVVDHWGTLHVFDYKYGAGVPVSVRENLQMIFYGLGLAYKFNWNFKVVRLWIIQPRIKGYDGPTFWETPMVELMKYVDIFKKGVERVLKSTGRMQDYAEGPHCHWCRCKSKCPLKLEKKLEAAKSVFTLASL